MSDVLRHPGAEVLTGDLFFCSLPAGLSHGQQMSKHNDRTVHVANRRAPTNASVVVSGQLLTPRPQAIARQAK